MYMLQLYSKAFGSTLRTVDQVFVEGLMVYGRHGVTDEEQSLGRPYRVDAWLSCDIRKAGASDDLGDAVDYVRVSQILAEEVGGDSRRLVETVAETTASRLLDEFPSVQTVRIRIAKLGPPTGHVSASAGVEVVRTRA